MPALPLDLAVDSFCTQRSSLVRGRVQNEAVRGAAWMVRGQILRDRLAVAIHEEQAMAVFVDLHVITGADPGPVPDLFLHTWIETARTEGATESIEISGEPLYYRVWNLTIRVVGSARLLCIDLDEFLNPSNAAGCWPQTHPHHPTWM